MIVQSHPDYEITCLVRNSDKGAKVAAQYSKIRLVYGDLDSSDLLVEEAEKADIICRMLVDSPLVFEADQGSIQRLG